MGWKGWGVRGREGGGESEEGCSDGGYGGGDRLVGGASIGVRYRGALIGCINRGASIGVH